MKSSYILYIRIRIFNVYKWIKKKGYLFPWKFILKLGFRYYNTILFPLFYLYYLRSKFSFKEKKRFICGVAIILFLRNSKYFFSFFFKANFFFRSWLFIRKPCGYCFSFLIFLFFFPIFFYPMMFARKKLQKKK